MLDDEEFAVVSKLYHDAFRSLKTVAAKVSAEESLIDAVLAPVRDEYFRMTGFRETSAAAILHHALSIYGPPCRACGKPLRTPRAKLCAACGTPAEG